MCHKTKPNQFKKGLEYMKIETGPDINSFDLISAVEFRFWCVYYSYEIFFADVFFHFILLDLI